MSRHWGKIVCSCSSREAEMYVEDNKHVLRCPDCGKSLSSLRTFDPNNWQDERDSYAEVLRRWSMGEETEANLLAAQQDLQRYKRSLDRDPDNWVKQQFYELALEKVKQIADRLGR